MSTTKTETITGDTLREKLEKIFFPIVQDGNLDKFKSEWENWLVLTNEVEDQKMPGKLKIEFCTQNGEMYALAPKSYYAHCRDTDANKDARKGIPNWFPLDLEVFHDVLYSEKHNNHHVEVRSLRLNKEKQMTRTTTIKSGLTGIHVKLSVQNDKVTCRPLEVNGKTV